MAELIMNYLSVRLQGDISEYKLNGKFKLQTDKSKAFCFQGNLDHYIEKIVNKYPNLALLTIRTNSDIYLQKRIKNYKYEIKIDDDFFVIVIEFKKD